MEKDEERNENMKNSHNYIGHTNSRAAADGVNKNNMEREK